MTVVRRVVLRLVLVLFGLAVPIVGFLLAQALFWHGSLRGTRVVTAAALAVLQRPPTADELRAGVTLWRQSPEAFERAIERLRAERSSEDGYGLGLVDQDGRRISSLAGPLTVMLDPFTVYVHKPNQRTRRFTIDERGFRRTPRRDGKPRLALVGGSAAFGYGLPSDETTLAWRLAERFPELEILNAAVVGYVSGQELALMVHRLDTWRPTAYLVLHGWNEVYDQAFTRHRTEGQFGVNNQFFDVQNRLYHHYLMASGAAVPRVAEWPAARVDARYLRALFDAYALNVERMHAFASARGARFLVALQPELGEKTMRTPEEQRALTSWNQRLGYVDRGVSATYAAFVHSATAHCQAQRLACVSLASSPAIRDARETLFLDPVHLSERGQVLMADALEPHVRRLLAAP
jgi:lysophospholipase L1-like esterase